MSRFLRSFGLLMPFLALLLLLLPACESDSDTETDTDGDGGSEDGDHEIEDGDNGDADGDGGSEDGDEEEDDYISTACPEEPLDGLLALRTNGGWCTEGAIWILHIGEDFRYVFSYDVYVFEDMAVCAAYGEDTLATISGSFDQALLSQFIEGMELAFATAPSACVSIFDDPAGVRSCDGMFMSNLRVKAGEAEYFYRSAFCPPDPHPYEWVRNFESLVAEASRDIYRWAHAEARAQATPLGEGDPCPQVGSLCAEGLRCDSRNRVCKAVE